jgi:hypothetical protein
MKYMKRFCLFLFANIVFCIAILAQENKAQNPIIFADVPDMSMIRVGNTYYMSSTTMHMAPGCAHYEIERFGELGTGELCVPNACRC